jgi:hypothetical protein
MSNTSWMGIAGEMVEFEHAPHDDEYGNGDYVENPDGVIDRYNKLSKRGQALLAEMIEAESIIQESGWLDTSPDGINTTVQRNVQPDIIQSGKQWKATVQKKRQEVIEKRKEHMPKTSYQTDKMDATSTEFNQVKVVDWSYLSKAFKAEHAIVQTNIDTIATDFRLNTEQDRAYRIITNHTVTTQGGQLKMYLGGMGGTGKTQVIRAISTFLNRRNEAHRFIILGPTGTSAALLGGYTYHSFLGIGGGDKQESHLNIAQLKQRLEGVDYIFIDEISMVSCHALYKISRQLALALHVYDMPFGGMNMIFAGDFAQLPPVMAHALYSGSVGTQIESATDMYSQENAIGKALWHQVTTVVILRENMRQVTQTLEDAKLRTALMNMRYSACTVEDICFLRSCIAGRRKGQPHIAQKQFRDVAIICGRNSERDKINELGSERFANDRNQKLVQFYSIDKWGKQSKSANQKQKTHHSNLHETDDIDAMSQNELWKLSPGSTEHFPGKLSLCLGMPVILKHNDATELCITNGQEGFVAGWHATKGHHGFLVLEVLFVLLNNPPQPIQIPGLPENVVPIVKQTKTIRCKFPSDVVELVERQQVFVLHNFAMTAHASQGKTRPINLAHLNSCDSHMAYYTALSRSASAAATVIIQGFDSYTITRGCSGYLRQEFREQELLNDITRHVYENTLSCKMDGYTRNHLIRQYQQLMGAQYVPHDTDLGIKWSANNPFHLLPIIKDSEWQLVENTKSNRKKGKIPMQYVPAKGTTTVTPQKLKRKHSLDTKDSIATKMQKTTETEPHIQFESEYEVQYPPLGTTWDGINWSCAYDSLIVILYDIWIKAPHTWSKRFKYMRNEHLNALNHSFKLVKQGVIDMEAARDDIRVRMHALNPAMFPFGAVGASVANLANQLLSSQRKNAKYQVACTNCDYEQVTNRKRLGLIITPAQSYES